MAIAEESPESQPRKRTRGADAEQTKKALASAAFDSLRYDGFRGTTARSIAARSGSNQAGIYYHFGGIEPLLLEALKQSSARRLDRYREELEGKTDLVQLLDSLERLYVEDVESGHMAVLAQMMGGITTMPELREGLNSVIDPWTSFVEEQIREIAAKYPAGALVPAKDLADLLLSVVTGLELRNSVDEGGDRAVRLFRLARLLVPLVDQQ